MQQVNVSTKTSAAWATSTLFGVLSGIGGLVHGIGEILQGSVSPGGLVFDSWTEGRIATNMGGEPAMSVVPNLLITGILTTIVSVAVIVWTVAFMRRPHAGLVLLLLALLMLLVGGGFGPPIIGMLAGVASLRIGSRRRLWRRSTSNPAGLFLAKAWPWVYAVSAINATFLVIGSLLLVYLVNLNAPDLFVASFFLAVVSLLATLLTGAAYDVHHQEPQFER